MKFTVNMLLTCIIYCDAGPGRLMKTAWRFLSRMSYLSLYVFLRRHHSLTSRNLYICLEMLLYCLHTSDRAYVSRARCIGVFLLLFILTPHDSSCSCLRVSLLTVLRVVYAIVRLSSGKTMVSILHVDLISCWYFYNTLYV